MAYNNLELATDEGLLYINHDAYLNDKSGDLFITNKNLIFGMNVNVSLFKKNYQVIKIPLNEILILGNKYKIWLSDEDDAYKCRFLTINSNQDYAIYFEDCDEDSVKDFMIILINILNFVYK